METGKLNGSNSEVLDSTYKSSLINPLKAEVENDINYFIVQKGLQITDWKFQIIDNDPNKTKKELTMIQEKANIATMLIEKAIMSPNEARLYLSELNLEESTEEGMNDFYYNGSPLIKPEESEVDEESFTLPVVKALQDEIDEYEKRTIHSNES